MTFTIEFTDSHFRLVITENGEDDYDAPVLYCSVSSIVAKDGKVYGAYLTGSEPDLTTVERMIADAIKRNADEEYVASLVSASIKVYDLSEWPNLRPLDQRITVTGAEFEGLDDEEDEEDEESGKEIIEVEPIV